MLEDQILKFNQYAQLISVTVKFILRSFSYKMIKCALLMCKRIIGNINKVADNNNKIKKV